MRTHRALAVLLVLVAIWLVPMVFVGRAVAAEHFVTTVGLMFVPDDLSIADGDTVTWSNDGRGFHNVLADDNSFRCANGCDDTGGNGNLSSALWSFSRVFSGEGDAPYYCEFHGIAGGIGMSGVIRVPEPSSTQLAWAALAALALLVRARP